MDQTPCPKCQQPIPAGVKFCPECGTPIDSRPAPKEAASKPKAEKSTAVRDTLIIVGALALVTAGYFIFKDKPLPPLPSTEMSTPSTPSQPSAQSGTQSTPQDPMAGMNAALLDSLPKDYNSLVLQGNNYMDHGQYAVGAECYRRALAISEESQDVRVDYGACLHAMGLPDRALEEFRKVLAKNPRHPIANFNMGIVFSDKQMKDSSVYYMKRYLSIDPNGQAAPTARQFLQQNGG